jgi:hypothetical protein
MGKLESVLHAKFDGTRMHGEWFRLTDQEVKWLKRLRDRWSSPLPRLPLILSRGPLGQMASSH